MKYYFAPMEGITGYAFRNVYHAHTHMVDEYFTPFIVGNRKASMKSKELRDILPENNQQITIIPQILSKDPVEFINTARRIASLGYSEMNLNLGCPSGTVVSKGRGAGFLGNLEELEEFFQAVMPSLSDLSISVKTRVGLDSIDAWDEILDIYEKLALKELIIHPRTRKEGYSGTIHRDLFWKAVERMPFPVVYNGELWKKKDLLAFYEENEAHGNRVKAMMLGRGLLANPFLLEEETMAEAALKERFLAYYMDLFESYRKEIPGERDILFKMKELWNYQILAWEDGRGDLKEIRKASTVMEYKIAVKNLVRNGHLSKER
ncbi:MAG: tRNA-dihydrouridine synthase family protein [Lachnospiraceae bacterium]|nr:tRNA-dihydrouridine synthase family protein [Lachnospiraceae bacterium]